MAEQPQELTSLVVAADAAGQRLDLYLAAHAGGASRAKMQKVIAAQGVKVNGRVARAKQVLASGDLIEVLWPLAPASTLTPVAMALDILYEDADLIVLNKAAQVTVHPGAGDTGPTLVQGLLYHCGKLGTPPPRPGEAPVWHRPGIVHRLDKDTTGVLVCAKTDRAHADLARQFHDKTTLQRSYVALLDGCMQTATVLHASYLHRDPLRRLRFASMPEAAFRSLHRGRPQRGYRYAKSLFSRQAVYGQRLTLAQVRLFTGRTHQIRVHACDLRLPILGDSLYHRPAQLPLHFPDAVRAAVANLQRQMLHAQRLVLRHPVSGLEMTFEAPLPLDFAHVLSLLSEFESAL